MRTWGTILLATLLVYGCKLVLVGAAPGGEVLYFDGNAGGASSR